MPAAQRAIRLAQSLAGLNPEPTQPVAAGGPDEPLRPLKQTSDAGPPPPCARMQAVQADDPCGLPAYPHTASALAVAIVNIEMGAKAMAAAATAMNVRFMIYLSLVEKFRNSSECQP